MRETACCSLCCYKKRRFQFPFSIQRHIIHKTNVNFLKQGYHHENTYMTGKKKFISPWFSPFPKSNECQTHQSLQIDKQNMRRGQQFDLVRDCSSDGTKSVCFKRLFTHSTPQVLYLSFCTINFLVVCLPRFAHPSIVYQKRLHQLNNATVFDCINPKKIEKMRFY